MNGYETFRICQSLKLHFAQESFDAVKYHFKTGAKPGPFQHHRNKFFYEKIGRKYDTKERLIDYFTANWIGGATWVGDMEEERLTKFEKNMQSIVYLFKEDLKIIHEEQPNFNLALKGPLIIDLLIPSRIHLETVALLDILVNFLKDLRVSLDDPLEMYSWQIMRAQKYRKLLGRKNLPIAKLKETALGVFV